MALPADIHASILDAARLALGSVDQSADRLASVLYHDWYGARDNGKPLMEPIEAPPFVPSLRAAHEASSRWERGWIAERVSPDGQVVAARSGVSRLFWPGDYAAEDRPGLGPTPGAPIAVMSRLDSTELSPGFWFTWSADWFNVQELLVRLYWNAQPAGAPELVRQLTSALSRVPYALKVPVDPAGFNRRDAVVAYLPASAFADLRALLAGVHANVAPWLCPEVPTLTRRLADGFSAAESQWNASESFGQNRCRIVAHAFAAAAARRSSEDEIVLTIIEAFTRDGLDPARPWLDRQRRGLDVYEL